MSNQFEKLNVGFCGIKGFSVFVGFFFHFPSSSVIKTSLSVAAPEVKHVRPASAKVGSGELNNTRAPRAASAGPSRTPVTIRPKAAAHIIMSSEAAGHMADGSITGITVHKSQLEKKASRDAWKCIMKYYDTGISKFIVSKRFPN